MPKVPPKPEEIRCKECGYTTKRFHGWVFAVTSCTTPNIPSSRHNWEAVIPDARPA